MNHLNLSPFTPFLDKLVSRNALSEEEQRAILTLPGKTVQVPANCDVVRLGERVDNACLVIEGILGRFDQSTNGDRQTSAVYIQGDMPDLYSMVAPHACSALHALSVCTLFKVPHDALWAVGRRYPAVIEAFWRECVVDAAILSQWVVNVGRRDAVSRTAHLLCEMACRYGAVDGDGGSSFAFPVTQTQLADIVALTPVHVNRTLRVLRERELANVASRNVDIIDWKRLRDIADFDADYLHIGQSARTECAVADAMD